MANFRAKPIHMAFLVSLFTVGNLATAQAHNGICGDIFAGGTAKSDRKIIFLSDLRLRLGPPRPPIETTDRAGSPGGNLVSIDGGYRSRVAKRLTVIREDRSYPLTPEDMRSLWLQMRLRPRAGDLFRRDYWATSDLLQVDRVKGDHVAATNLRTHERLTVSTERNEGLDGTAEVYFPALPGGLTFPFTNWSITIVGHRDWVFTRQNERNQWLALEQGVLWTTDLLNLDGFESKRDREQNLDDHPLGVFEVDRAAPSFTLQSRVEDTAGQYDLAIQADDRFGNRTLIQRSQVTYDMTSASLARLQAEMRSDPQPGDEYFSAKVGQIFVVGRSGDGLVVQQAPDGKSSRMKIADFESELRTPFLIPLLPSGVRFPNVRGDKLDMNYPARPSNRRIGDKDPFEHVGE